MRNKSLPKLLRAIAGSSDAQKSGLYIIFIEAANELQKLDQIEVLIQNKTVSKETLLEILNDAP